MTRASLLHILDHVTGISEAEVRELEQLAATFPYCQTAHLLLAKAAHDRGNMLASQRLRRAATYAADRELLRRLMEMQPVAAVAQSEAVAPAPAAEPAPQETYVSQPDSEPIAAVAELDSLEAETAEAAALPDTFQAEPSVTESEEIVTKPAGLVGESTDAEALEAQSVVLAETIETSDTEEHVTAEPEAGSAVEELAPVPPTSDEQLAELEEMPPAAPPIRPPVEAGSSRFEFGLAEATEPLPVYQLPELDETEEVATANIPAYRADEQLAYALSMGSRLGEALVLRTEELTHDLPVAPSWYPDAPLLAHAAAHRPVAPVSSLALIDRFLRSQPRLKTATPRPLTPQEPQADLSARSTSKPPTLASESLANILIKQGKIARAIEIYEQLMQRQPEKKAYFAAQIDQLKQQPE